jgi:hypothetical protein
MSLGTTVILYLLIGIGVAVAVAARSGHDRGELIFRVLAAVPFWPLFVPLLLSHTEPVSVVEDQILEKPRDDLDQLIAQADAELSVALNSLGGWAGHVLIPELGRIEELRAAWQGQAERVRELDRLLARPGPELPPAAGGEGTPAAERLRQAEGALRQNQERLRQLRARLHDDLLGSLARVRELASLIHLARFTGAPAARAEELIAGIATAVEGISGSSQAGDRSNRHVIPATPDQWDSLPPVR